MNLNLAALASVVLLLTACGDPAPPERSQEDVARAAFEALRLGEAGPLLEVALRAEDLRWLAASRTDVPPENAAAMEARLEGDGAERMADQGREAAERAFAEARSRSAEEIGWDAAAFDGLMEGPSRSRLEEGIPTATTVFVVRSGERQEVFTLARCVRTPDGWRVGGPLRWVPNPHAGDTGPRELMTDLALQFMARQVVAFRAAQGRLPESLAEASTLAEDGAAASGPPEDAWGAPVAYRVESPDRWQIRSAGPDGVLDSADDRVVTQADAAPPDPHGGAHGAGQGTPHGD